MSVPALTVVCPWYELLPMVQVPDSCLTTPMTPVTGPPPAGGGTFMMPLVISPVPAPYRRTWRAVALVGLMTESILREPPSTRRLYHVPVAAMVSGWVMKLF